jgi:hypothetical protein
MAFLVTSEENRIVGGIMEILLHIPADYNTAEKTE